MSWKPSELFTISEDLGNWSVNPIRHRSEVHKNAQKLQSWLADTIHSLCGWLNDQGHGALAACLDKYYVALIAQAEALDAAYTTTSVNTDRFHEAEKQAFQAAALRVAYVIRAIDEDMVECVCEDETEYSLRELKGTKWREFRVYPLYRDIAPEGMLSILEDWLKYQHLIDAIIAIGSEHGAFKLWVESLQAGAIVLRAAIDSSLPVEPICYHSFGLYLQVAEAGVLADWWGLDFSRPVMADEISDAKAGAMAKARSNLGIIGCANKLRDVYQGKTSTVEPVSHNPADDILLRVAGALRDWAEANKWVTLVSDIFREPGTPTPSESDRAESKHAMDRIHKLRRKAAEAAVEAYPLLVWCSTNLSCPVGPVGSFVEAVCQMKRHRDAGEDYWATRFGAHFSQYRNIDVQFRNRIAMRDEAGEPVKDIPKVVAMQIADHIERWASKVANKGGSIPSVPPVLGDSKETRAADKDVAAIIANTNSDVADGGPFWKPAHFDQWNIGGELLRKNSIDGTTFVAGKVRRINKQANPKKRAVYWYSEPDARRLWAHKFAD